MVVLTKVGHTVESICQSSFSFNSVFGSILVGVTSTFDVPILCPTFVESEAYGRLKSYGRSADEGCRYLCKGRRTVGGRGKIGGIDRRV